MESPLSHYEHEQYMQIVDAKMAKLEAEDKRLNERMKAMEETTRQINALALSVQKMADSIQAMTKEMERQNEEMEVHSNRITNLEGRDGEKWRKVVEHAVTVIVGLILGYIFAQLGIAG